MAGLANHPFGSIVKPVAVAIGTSDNPRGHNRLAALANFEVFRSIDYFLRPRRPLGKVIG